MWELHFRSKTLGVMQGYVIQDPWVGAIEKRLDNEESDEGEFEALEFLKKYVGSLEPAEEEDQAEEGNDNDDENDATSMPKKQQQQSISTTTTSTSAPSSHGNSHSSDVGTDIVSNTARYLANKSNIMARQLIENEVEDGEEGFIGDDNDNINGDHAAGAVAKSLKSRRLLLMTNVEGVLNREKKLISEINSSKIIEMIEDKTITEGMIPKINTCLDAVKNDVTAVGIIDGRKPRSVLFELFSDRGSGTLIRK